MRNLGGDHDPGIPLHLDVPLLDAETAQPVEVARDALRERQVFRRRAWRVGCGCSAAAGSWRGGLCRSPGRCRRSPPGRRRAVPAPGPGERRRLRGGGSGSVVRPRKRRMSSQQRRAARPEPVGIASPPYSTRPGPLTRRFLRLTAPDRRTRLLAPEATSTSGRRSTSSANPPRGVGAFGRAVRSWFRRSGASGAEGGARRGCPTRSADGASVRRPRPPRPRPKGESRPGRCGRPW